MIRLNKLDHVGRFIRDRRLLVEHMKSSLTEGIAPWGSRLPRRLDASPFKGVVRFHLSVESRQRGLQGRHWATLEGWHESGYCPDPSQGIETFEGDHFSAITMYPSDAVADFVEGIVEPDYATADRIFDALGVRLKRRILPRWVREGALDWVEMPRPENVLRGINHYYSLLFHEVTHWVVLGRRLGAEFDLPEGQQEFLTDLSASIVCDHCGIPFDLVTTKWQDDWVEGLNDPDYFFDAVEIAERAAAFILQWEK